MATDNQLRYDIAVTGTGQAVTNINAVTMAQQRLNMSSANAGVALQNLNFVIRDSPYFFRDFSLGLLAVGNNLNPLIDSMLRLRREAEAVNMTLGQSLVAALKGPAGVVLAFSALVTILQAVVFGLSKTGKEAKETKDEIDDLTKATEKYSRATAESAAMGLRGEIGSRKGAILKENEADIKFAIGITRKLYPSRSDAELRAMAQETAFAQDEELKKLYEKLSVYERYLDNVGWERNLRNEINELEDLRLKSTKEVAANLQVVIDGKRKELDSVLKLGKAEDDRLKKLKEQQSRWMEQIEAIMGVGRAYGFVSEQEEKLFKKRIDLMEMVRERAIRSGMSPEQAEAFGLGMSMQLQSPDTPMWGGGAKKLPEHPLKDLQKPVKEVNKQMLLLKTLGTEVGEVLTRAFMGAKISLDDLISSIAMAIIKMAILSGINSVSGGMGGNALDVVSGGSGLAKLGYGANRIDINLRGTIESKQNKFVVDLSKAQKRYNKNMVISSGDYIQT